MLVHTSLYTYYARIGQMAQHFNYSITEMEDMHPFELTLYHDMIMNFIHRKEGR